MAEGERMADGWLIAFIAQWILLVSLALVVLAHSRLLGLLHARLGPAGARPLADGPPIGAKIGQLSGRLLDGSPWDAQLPQHAEVILIFISPQCETCNALLRHANDFIRAKPQLLVKLVSTIDDIQMNRAYVSYRRIDARHYVLGEKMAHDLDIEGTPYALRIDESGRLVAKGIVNSFENLIGLAKQKDIPAFDEIANTALTPPDVGEEILLRAGGAR
jgi:methylamine dehydrogenase accessory protein MauD